MWVSLCGEAEELGRTGSGWCGSVRWLKQISWTAGLAEVRRDARMEISRNDAQISETRAETTEIGNREYSPDEVWKLGFSGESRCVDSGKVRRPVLRFRFFEISISDVENFQINEI